MITMYPKPTIPYPSIESHIIFWRNPFREGAKEILYDEIRISVGCIYDGKEYSEGYVIYFNYFGKSIIDVIDMLKEEIIKKIENIKP